jgi:hypothetical protein
MKSAHDEKISFWPASDGSVDDGLIVGSRRGNREQPHHRDRLLLPDGLRGSLSVLCAFKGGTCVSYEGDSTLRPRDSTTPCWRFARLGSCHAMSRDVLGMTGELRWDGRHRAKETAMGLNHARRRRDNLGQVQSIGNCKQVERVELRSRDRLRAASAACRSLVGEA